MVQNSKMCSSKLHNTLAWLLSASLPILAAFPAGALGVGVMSTHAPVRVHVVQHAQSRSSNTVNRRHPTTARQAQRASSKRRGSAAVGKSSKKGKAAKKPAAPAKPLQPQAFTDKMGEKELAPGVVHKYFRGPLSINLIDIDMAKAPVKVQPALANNTFTGLKDVAEEAKESHALAAINANYFKKDGTPLGTLIIDGEWVAGPIYDRVSMGITREGKIRIDRVALGGQLTSNNPELPKSWVNNINQPRRTGCHLFAYTHRWGSSVRLPGAGTLVALDARGNVVDKSTTEMGIPWGGYVLADSKDAPISKLQRGDVVSINWISRPGWDDVVEAVSGGPILIKDGKLYVDLKDENFRRNWTGSQIKARTVAGVTNNNHLLLATVEGPHTLWDIAKFMQKMGAVDALNLDGGGSTQMVVDGNTVTKGVHQRRVASSIVVLDMRKASLLSRNEGLYGPRTFHAAPVVPTYVAPAAALEGAVPEAQPATAQTVQDSFRQPPSTEWDAVPQRGALLRPQAEQVQGIITPPARPVDVPVSTRQTPPGQTGMKKSHLFGLIGAQ